MPRRKSKVEDDPCICGPCTCCDKSRYCSVGVKCNQRVNCSNYEFCEASMPLWCSDIHGGMCMNCACQMYCTGRVEGNEVMKRFRNTKKAN